MGRREARGRAEPGRGGAWGTADAAILAACLIALAASLAPCRDYVNDDAFISYRYAANLLAGEGLTFNPGERVEGYTNFLWVLASAALLATGGPDAILPLARWTGALCAALTVVVTFAVGRHWFDSRVAAGGAALLLAASPSFAANAVNGLETGLYALLIALALLLRAVPRAHADAAFAFVMALASLTRPEGFYVTAILLPVHLAAGVSWRRVVRIGAAYSALVAPYLLWKLSYYGSLLPNTYYAKPGSIAEGLEYAGSFVLGAGFLRPAALPLLAFVVGLVALPRARVWLAGFFTALASAVVLSGGDWMLGWRFWVPALSVICLAMGATLDRLHALVSRRGRLMALAAPIGLLLALSFGLSLPGDAIVAECRARGEGQRSAHLAIGRWLAANARRGESVALMDVGMIGFHSFYAGVRIIDITGLTDATIGRAPGRMLRKNYDPGYVLDQQPEYVVLVGGRSPESAGMEPGALAGRGWELVRRELWFQDRRIAEAPSFREDYELLFSRRADFEGSLYVFGRRGAAPSPGPPPARRVPAD